MTTNPTYRPSEGKREEFRKYLEKNGVMDALTKVLVNLYEEPDKPEDALQYIRDKLAVQAGLETLSQMKGKVEDAEKRITDLEKEIEDLKLLQIQAEGQEAAEDDEQPAVKGEMGEEQPPLEEEPNPPE